MPLLNPPEQNKTFRCNCFLIAAIVITVFLSVCLYVFIAVQIIKIMIPHHNNNDHYFPHHLN